MVASNIHRASQSGVGTMSTYTNNSNDDHHEVGWLLTAHPCHVYDVFPLDGKSLQSKSLELLAKSIPDYLDNNPDWLDRLFALTQCSSLATLSVYCSSPQHQCNKNKKPVMNEQLAGLFLKQSHARRLSIHFASSQKRKQPLDRILRLVSKHFFGDNMDNNSREESELERLELVNVELSVDSLAQLLSLFPSLTHLSLSNSKLSGVCLFNKLNGMVSKHGIRFLDLSHCAWVNDDFVRDLVLTDNLAGHRLQWVGLGGRTRLLKPGSMNTKFQGRLFFDGRMHKRSKQFPLVSAAAQNPTNDTEPTKKATGVTTIGFHVPPEDRVEPVQRLSLIAKCA